MSGYFFRRIEPGRLEDPALDLRPVEARVPDLFGIGHRQFAEQRVVEPGQLLRRRGRRDVDDVKIPHRRGRGQHRREPAAAAIGRIRHDLVMTASQRFDAGGGGIDTDIDPYQVRVTLFAHLDENRAAVGAPDGPGGMLPARRALIAADRAVDVEVVRRGQVAGCATDVRHPQVRLAVGPFRVAVQGSDKGDARPVRRGRVGADGAVDARDHPGLAAVLRYGVQVGVVGEIVALAPAFGHEVDRGAVNRPLVIAGRERARGDLLRRGRPAVDRHGPDLRRPIAVHVSGPRHAVRAVDGLGDDTHVALARFLLVGGRRLGCELVRPGRGRERDGAAVGRPHGVAGSARHLGHRARLAARHVHDVHLGRLHLAVLLRGPDEGQPAAIGRPSGPRVAGAAGERARYPAAVGTRRPHTGVVLVLLVVDRDPNECHL